MPARPTKQYALQIIARQRNYRGSNDVLYCAWCKTGKNKKTRRYEHQSWCPTAIARHALGDER